ncbi:DMT family transporter [Indiicoccus explosivorum]|uniref:DMT family transporter n=1 Tax=Indiicoccus explosivorum TaxID=1917864 RepID=UPI000B44475F|nr:DMT family transporter [Indiicoccus explosivorum]
MGKKRWKGIVLVLLGASFWGIGGTVAQRLFQESGIEVGWLVSVRLLIAGILLLGISLFAGNQRKMIGIWKDRKAAVQLVLFGLGGMLAVQYTYMASISFGNAAVATLLQYLAPVFILLYYAFVRKNRLRLKEVLTVTLALTGTLLLLTNGSAGNLSVPFPAIAWGVLSGVALAFYTLYAGQLLMKWGSLNVIGWAMVIGGAGMGLIHPPWQADTVGWTAGTLLFLAFVILFGTMFAFWFYLESLKYLNPQDTSVLGSVEPLSAIAASVVWLHVPFGMYQLAGAGLILLMVFYLSAPEERTEPVQTAATNR